MKLQSAFFFVVFSFLLLFSCKDESSSVGGNWVTSAFQDFITDTCTVTLSTILSDSLATSGDSICQVGRHKDNLYGDIITSFYAEYQVPSFSFDETTTYQYDSITFKWFASGNYLGDTLVNHYIDLYPLLQGLSLEDDGYLYNKTNVGYNLNRKLGTIAIRPTPGDTREEHELRLPDEWGREWFSLMMNDDTSMESQDEFRAYFEGIAFIPDNDRSTCINGFQVNDSSFCITLYYHELKEKPTEMELVFKASNTYNYTKVEVDRSDTPIASLSAGADYKLPSSQSSNQSYLQGLTGMYVDIDFPYLNDLKVEGRMVTIESATLKLCPASGTYGGKYPLPESLTLFTVDENNNIQNVVTDISGETVQSGNLYHDDVYGEETYYSFDLTSFIQNNFGKAGKYREKLQLFLPSSSFYSTVQGVVFADQKHSLSDGNDNVELKVYYKVYME